MAIHIRLQQNKIKGSKSFGKYFGHAYHPATIDIEGIAQRMQANCTVKRADIIAVITELQEVIKRKISESYKVQIERLGVFKVSITTSGVTEPSAFTSSNIKSYRVIFSPTRHVLRTKGTIIGGKYVGGHTSIPDLLQGEIKASVDAVSDK